MLVGLRSVKFQWHVLLMALPWFAGLALADQAVYKCGQEITNQPNDPSQCQKLLISNPTQIEGTSVQNGQSPKPVSAVSGTAAERISIPPTKPQDALQRNVQARTVLEDEWQKLSAKHAEMVRVFNGGQPALQEGESLQNPQYKRRVADMQIQIERMARDLMALKRELSRHTSQLASVPSK
jgi:hypothetical protein